MTLDALTIASALGQVMPTPEQREVIEAPPGPVLVVAGAGSGKTETMAARVVWLVANGHVESDEVLGLTFTRKAAGELASRIAARLGGLADLGLLAPGSSGSPSLPTLPTVSTYHAYAGRIVREHGLRLGVEPTAALLTEASAWQLAARAVESGGSALDAMDYAESTLTAAVLEAAGELAEHLVSPDEVDATLGAVAQALDKLPASSARGLNAPVRELRDRLRTRRVLTPLLQRYAELKREHDAMDFADQMALAARLAERFCDIGAIERDRYRVVLLDEFQDTSHAQLVLLRTLFAPAGVLPSVTAVGDPHQSIYGWRGASSVTLSAFAEHFGGSSQVRTLPLRTSWRNDSAVLAAANAVAAPLRATSVVPVAPLVARENAAPGRVRAARFATSDEEAEAVAGWLASRGAGAGRSAAVLLRKRSQFPEMIAALQARGLPVEVVGLGGLLLTPEVSDLVAVLHVVHEPARGDHLMRLLTGPVVRLGAADLVGLWEWARQSQAPGPGEVDRPSDLSPDSAAQTTLAEILDELPPPGWSGRRGEQLSGPARERLHDLAATLGHLRRLPGQALAELIGAAERALGLDIELAVRPGHTPATARMHVDALIEVASQFTASADHPTLGAFLAYLDAAIEHERGLDTPVIATDNDAVQVLTVHAAKGQEWDLVAVPGLVEGTFPAHNSTTSRWVDGMWTITPPTDTGWLGSVSTGGLPFELRGDAAALPTFAWRSFTDDRDAREAIDRFKRDLGAHGLDEERRLAYVAFTRARHELFLSASVWGSGKSPKVTSRFLVELVQDPAVELPIGTWAPMPEADIRQLETASPRLAASWPPVALPAPVDLRAQAQLVIEALNASADSLPEPSPDVALVLAAREARRAGVKERPRVRHLSASGLVDLVNDPHEFAVARVRPMPQGPDPRAEVGRRFHAWVDAHYRRPVLLELDGDLWDPPGDSEAVGDLAHLQAAFLASTWAQAVPIDTELAVETVVGSLPVRCRTDAVFGREDGGFTIVDWKTGHPPAGSRATTQALQLAAYRLAFARYAEVSPDLVDGAFFYAETGDTVYPKLADEARLVEALAVLPGGVLVGGLGVDL